jgi:hypothetical protein
LATLIAGIERLEIERLVTVALVKVALVEIKFVKMPEMAVRRFEKILLEFKLEIEEDAAVTVANVFVAEKLFTCAVCAKSIESKPSSLSATNAEGTEPTCLRGDISPSQEGVLAVPPISTER